MAQAPDDTAPPGEPTLIISVEKDEPATGCPDLTWFKSRIASHAGKAGQTGSFKIKLTRQNDAYIARIERQQPSPSAERVLQDRSASCEPLAEAASVAVAILADVSSQHDEPAAQDARPSTPSVSPVVPSAPKVESGASPSDNSKLWAGASGGAAVSFISPVAPLFGLSGALDYAYLRAGVRFMMTTEQKFALDPGRVFVQAWLTTLYGCLQSSQGHFAAALCVAADASVLRATAEGFEQGKPGTRGYEAVGLEVHPSWYISEGFRVSAVLGSLLPFTRESFSVTGRGAAYVPPRANLRFLLVSEIGVF
jgi:hypothetical protein